MSANAMNRRFTTRNPWEVPIIRKKMSKTTSSWVYLRISHVGRWKGVHLLGSLATTGSTSLTVLAR